MHFVSPYIDETRLKGLAMHIATHTDIMDNPHYGVHKLSPTLLHTMDNEVQLATTQDLTKVSGHTYIAAGLCI